MYNNGSPGLRLVLLDLEVNQHCISHLLQYAELPVKILLKCTFLDNVRAVTSFTLILNGDYVFALFTISAFVTVIKPFTKCASASSLSRLRALIMNSSALSIFFSLLILIIIGVIAFTSKLMSLEFGDVPYYVLIYLAPSLLVLLSLFLSASAVRKNFSPLRLTLLLAVWIIFICILNINAVLFLLSVLCSPLPYVVGVVGLGYLILMIFWDIIVAYSVVSLLSRPDIVNVKKQERIVTMAMILLPLALLAGAFSLLRAEAL
jgi:hypothetical protein